MMYNLYIHIHLSFNMFWLGVSYSCLDTKIWSRGWKYKKNNQEKKNEYESK